MRRSDQNRRQVVMGSDERDSSDAWLVREPSLGCFFNETCGFWALSLCVRTLRSTAPASKNEGLAYRSARRGGRTTCPRKTTKIDRKIDPKSIEVGHSGYVEAPKSIEVGRSGQSKRPSRSKWLDRARSRRPRSLVASSHWRATVELADAVGWSSWQQAGGTRRQSRSAAGVIRWAISI